MVLIALLGRGGGRFDRSIIFEKRGKCQGLFCCGEVAVPTRPIISKWGDLSASLGRLLRRVFT